FAVPVYCVLQRAREQVVPSLSRLASPVLLGLVVLALFYSSYAVGLMQEPGSQLALIAGGGYPSLASAARRRKCCTAPARRCPGSALRRAWTGTDLPAPGQFGCRTSRAPQRARPRGWPQPSRAPPR